MGQLDMDGRIHPLARLAKLRGRVVQISSCPGPRRHQPGEPAARGITHVGRHVSHHRLERGKHRSELQGQLAAARDAHRQPAVAGPPPAARSATQAPAGNTPAECAAACPAFPRSGSSTTPARHIHARPAMPPAAWACLPQSRPAPAPPRSGPPRAAQTTVPAVLPQESPRERREPPPVAPARRWPIHVHRSKGEAG